MHLRHILAVGEAVVNLCLGEGATERIDYDPADRLVELSGVLACRVEPSIPTCPVLVDALTAAYHLGRQHALERVAIGLSTEETPGLFRGRN
jgi:hypothetical protein